MKPIIFLDIDGVLNNSRWLRFHPSYRVIHTKPEELFDPVCVENLNKILNSFECDIVISSSWRYIYPIEQLREIFDTNSIDGNRIIDYTPFNGDEIRGKEIRQWFDKCITLFPSFIVIDDCISDIQPYIPDKNIVATIFEVGFDELALLIATNKIEEQKWRKINAPDTF